MKKLIFILTLFLFTFASEAQQRFSSYRSQNSSAGFRGVGIGVGGAFPIFDYYADNTEYEFDFTPMASLSAEFWVSKPIAIRAGVGYLVSNGTSTAADEETSVAQLSGTVDALIYFTQSSRFSRKPKPSFYLGLGAEFVQLSVEHTPSFGDVQNLNGGTTLARILAGFEYPVTKQVKLGAELQYGMGTYEQGFEAGSVETLEEVSVSGARAMVTFKYVFSDYTPRARRGRYR
ncbi:MAG: hypothetical protein RIC03_02210 [Cyclobacteriaceae bacterium]